MNPRYFGDSYDIVKRFFVQELARVGYTVYVDPMWTGASEADERSFVQFLGATHIEDAERLEEAALLIDPDTGIRPRRSKSHTTLRDVVDRLGEYDLAFVFDQSFSRSRSPESQMSEKLGELHDLDAHGFYYDSHARFLFCTRTENAARSFRAALLNLGLPEWRLVELAGRDA